MTPIPIILLSAVRTPRTPTPDWDPHHHHQREHGVTWEMRAERAGGQRSPATLYYPVIWCRVILYKVTTSIDILQPSNDNNINGRSLFSLVFIGTTEVGINSRYEVQS